MRASGWLLQSVELSCVNAENISSFLSFLSYEVPLTVTNVADPKFRIGFNAVLHGNSAIYLNADPAPGSQIRIPAASDPDPGQNLPSQKLDIDF